MRLFGQFPPALLALTLARGVLAQSSTLFHGATIIAFDEESSRPNVLRNSSLLVVNDRIAGLFENNSTDELPPDTEVIDATGRIISPGFIDTHHHLWQTAYKTLASNTTLAQYFQRYSEFSPATQNFSPDDIRVGQLAGCLELIYAGTTTVVDHAHGDFSNETMDAALDATLESGIRSIFAPAIHALDGYSIEDQRYKLLSLVDDPRLDNATVTLGLAYDRFYMAPQAEIDSFWDIVRSYNLSLVTSHFLGGPWSNTNSPQQLHELGVLNTSTPVILSHASFIDAISVELLRQTNQYISTTPESELHYGHMHPHTWQIQDQASLGVDTHFTFSTDMIGQARLWLQRLRGIEYRQALDDLVIPRNNPMSVEQAFLLITRNGALALRRPDIGMIKEGAKADLIMFDTGAPNMLGWDDPIAAIILHSNVGDIRDVMVDGKFVKRDGRLTFDNYANLRRDFLASAERIQRIWNERQWEPLQGLFQGVTPYGEADQIDVQRGPGTGY